MSVAGQALQARGPERPAPAARSQAGAAGPDAARLAQLAADINATPRQAEIAQLADALNGGAAHDIDDHRGQADESGTVAQRVVIAQGDVPGLVADLNTASLLASSAQIDALFHGGRRASLAALLQRVEAADQQENTLNNKALIRVLKRYVDIKSSDIAENAEYSYGEQASLAWKYLGTGNVAPDMRQGLRMWVSGDPDRGINWRMIGEHMRGRLGNDDYEVIGQMDHAKSHSGQPEPPQATLIQNGRALLTAAQGRIRGALDGLPGHDRVSYRQSGVASGNVYGGLIHTGDYIRDAAFWSTSALRQGGSAGQWGTDGTQNNPKVYFIVQGTTGKYISKAAAQEEGQHEVLFQGDTVFRVTKITNVQNKTFFVYVTEVDGAGLPQGTQIKNSFNGNVY